MDIVEIGSKIGLFFIPFLFAICFHEWAHAWMARKKGDPTAEMMGRLTLNPAVHIDPLGTVVFPIMCILTGGYVFFGWAKPVPFSVRNLRHPKNDTFWIAIAGPLSNLFLAIIGAFVLVAVARFYPYPQSASVLIQMLKYFVIINISLMIFNFIPIHPLDGGKIISRFLPMRANIWLEENSRMLGMALLALLVLDGFTGHGANFLSYPIQTINNALIGFFGYIFLIN